MNCYMHDARKTSTETRCLKHIFLSSSIFLVWKRWESNNIKSTCTFVYITIKIRTELFYMVFSNLISNCSRMFFRLFFLRRRLLLLLLSFLNINGSWHSVMTLQYALLRFSSFSFQFLFFSSLFVKLQADDNETESCSRLHIGRFRIKLRKKAIRNRVYFHLDRFSFWIQ